MLILGRLADSNCEGKQLATAMGNAQSLNVARAVLPKALYTGKLICKSDLDAMIDRSFVPGVR